MGKLFDKVNELTNNGSCSIGTYLKTKGFYISTMNPRFMNGKNYDDLSIGETCLRHDSTIKNNHTLRIFVNKKDIYYEIQTPWGGYETSCRYDAEEYDSVDAISVLLDEILRSNLDPDYVDDLNKKVEDNSQFADHNSQEINYSTLKDMLSIENHNILLIGKPGCGKTYAANKLSMDIPGLSISDDNGGNLPFDMDKFNQKPFVATIQSLDCIEAIYEFAQQYDMSLSSVLNGFDYIVTVNRDRYLITSIRCILKQLQ